MVIHEAINYLDVDQDSTSTPVPLDSIATARPSASDPETAGTPMYHPATREDGSEDGHLDAPLSRASTPPGSRAPTPDPSASHNAQLTSLDGDFICLMLNAS